MSNFKKGGFKQRSGRPGERPKFGNKFGGRRSGGDRPGGRMELFAAICSECKKNCQVPFRPSGDKPVYCRDCFNKQPQIPGRNSNGKDPRSQQEYTRTQNRAEIDTLTQQLIDIESKINRILEFLTPKTEHIVFSPEEASVIEKIKKEKTPVKKTIKKSKN